MQPLNNMDFSPKKPKSLYRELTIALIGVVILVSISVNLLNYTYLSQEVNER